MVGTVSSGVCTRSTALNSRLLTAESTIFAHLTISTRIEEHTPRYKYNLRAKTNKKQIFGGVHTFIGWKKEKRDKTLNDTVPTIFDTTEFDTTENTPERLGSVTGTRHLLCNVLEYEHKKILVMRISYCFYLYILLARCKRRERRATVRNTLTL